jgi:type IV secretory pathway VirB4 component
LTYLFMREARFDGRPTLLVLDEAWLFLAIRCSPIASVNG